MGDIIPEPTRLLLAAASNIIKHPPEKIVLNNLIEIGRRLTEAKGLIKYGEWGKWLKESVGFSQNRAEKLMRLYEAYGSQQPALGDAGAQARDLPNLSYTHALILLGVPEEDRAQFISDIDIESMTTRELQQAVNELKQSQQAKAGLQKTLDEEKEKNLQLAKECDNLKKETDDLRKSRQELQQNVEKKVMENKKLAEHSNLRSYQRVSNELAATQIKLLTSKVAFRFESLDKAFKELTYEMNLLAKIDPQVHGEYKKMLNDFLIKAMQERMGS
ncbi:DUF3102 domain-containing protein [Desulfosporosinus sp. PR]|uniref:DUF3102 domain-containing protein n=1 Tax=Candidatus Desulfosporosinus nitrosoreducens TaxID=3401928 RepID=UPI0027F7B1D0|nr:DUF3102 domain-containing protein [Desulfosporosinus sp. PR]MDQ7095212.1 DUF3102 domain-containing protein [Desulfosporosinus sp. PR]